jgi:hypothetical protein
VEAAMSIPGQNLEATVSGRYEGTLSYEERCRCRSEEGGMVNGVGWLV